MIFVHTYLEAVDVIAICRISTGGLDYCYRRLDRNTDQLSSCCLPVLWYSLFRNGDAAYATLHMVTVRFTLQQWRQLPATISNAITDTYTHIYTHWQEHLAAPAYMVTAVYYTTVVVTFTSSNIMYNNRHIPYVMSACYKTMKMKNSQVGVYMCWNFWNVSTVISAIKWNVESDH